MQSIFATTPPTTTPPLTPNTTEESTTEAESTTETETDTDTTETTETKPEGPIVRMPDGTEMPADTYVKTQVQEEMAKVNSEWEQVRQAALRDAETTTETETPESPNQDPPAWRVDVEDEDTFQSDVEKKVVSAHNALGEEVEKIGTRVEESLKKIETQVQSLGETSEKQDAQRQIENIERTKGVTEAELQAVYNAYNGTVKNLDALADIAVAKKSATEASEKRTEEATNDRKEAATTISGGGNSQTSGADDQPKGRGLEGKAIYDGASIAAKYSAFGS